MFNKMKAFFTARVSGEVEVLVSEKVEGEKNCSTLKTRKTIGAVSANKLALRFATLGGFSFSKLFGLSIEQEIDVLTTLNIAKHGQFVELRFVADGNRDADGFALRGYSSTVKSWCDFGTAQEFKLLSVASPQKGVTHV